MKRTNKLVQKQAITNMLPWLKNCYDLDGFEKIEILPVTLEALNTSCDYTLEYRGSGWNQATNRKKWICFFSSEGAYVGEVGEKYVPLSRFSPMRLLGHELQSQTFEETVIQAIKRLEQTTAWGKGIQYVVGVLREDRQKNMIIGKLPEKPVDWYNSEMKIVQAKALEEVKRNLGRK